MPWGPEDASRHDKKAKSAVAKRQWSDVANSVLKNTGDEGRAVREANAVIKRRGMAKFRGESHSYSHKRPKRKVVSRYAR